MECSHAYTKANSRYIYCDFEGEPTGTTLDDITPYLCWYQPFPPPYTTPVTMLTSSWADCMKLQQEKDNKKYVKVSDWYSDTTYTDYPYRAKIPMDGATTDLFPYVEFEDQEAESGMFADVSVTYDGGVYIYANTLPTYNFWVTVNLYEEMDS